MVDAAKSTVDEVSALLVDARLTAPENGQIATIFPKRGELVAPGTPIMNLVVMDDVHVVLNVREDLMPQFKMDGTFVADVPAIGKKILNLKSIISVRWVVLLPGNQPSKPEAMTYVPLRFMPVQPKRWMTCVPVCPCY